MAFFFACINLFKLDYARVEYLQQNIIMKGGLL